MLRWRRARSGEDVGRDDEDEEEDVMSKNQNQNQNPNQNVESVATLAIGLKRLRDRIDADLDSLLELLREDAMAHDWRELSTPSGTVRAAFVDPSYKPRKDADLGSLEEVLTRAEFAQLVTAQTVYRLASGRVTVVEELLASLAPKRRQAVEALIEEKPGVIRITLPSDPDDEGRSGPRRSAAELAVLASALGGGR